MYVHDAFVYYFVVSQFSSFQLFFYRLQLAVFLTSSHGLHDSERARTRARTCMCVVISFTPCKRRIQILSWVLQSLHVIIIFGKSQTKNTHQRYMIIFVFSSTALHAHGKLKNRANKKKKKLQNGCSNTQFFD